MFKELDVTLNQSEKAWIMFGDGSKDNAHALGVLRLGEDENMVANKSATEPYIKMTTGELADHLLEHAKYTDIAVCTVGFKKLP